MYLPMYQEMIDCYIFNAQYLVDKRRVLEKFPGEARVPKFQNII